MDKMLKSLSNEIAVTAFDNNTLAFGTAARVREAFGDDQIESQRRSSRSGKQKPERGC